MRYGLKTKEARETLLAGIFKRKVENGYAHEVYKGLNILTKHETTQDCYFLEVYRNKSTKPITNYYYKAADYQRYLKRIQECKDSYDRSIAFKAEQKVLNKGKQSSHAAAASAIKAELKTLFPNIKFNVRSESFSMGNSVHVSFIDGPTTSEVNDVIKKYQYGHFNGMDETYDYSNSRDDIPQAKYVSAQREMSAELKETLMPAAEAIYKENTYGCNNAENLLYQIFYATSLPAGAIIDSQFKDTGAMSGLCAPETFFRIGFTTNQAKTGTAPASEVVTPEEPVGGKIKIVDYSEKAIAVIGDTFPVKDKLKALGGKFNKFLTCGAGWIFPKTKLEEVKNAFKKESSEPDQPVNTDTPEESTELYRVNEEPILTDEKK